MKPTRTRDLVLALGITLVVAYLVLALLWYSLPAALPRSAPLSLLLVGVAVLQLASHTRRRLQGRPGSRPIVPLTVARLAALGRSSSMTGAVTLGAWGALLAWTLPRLGAPPVAGADAITAGLGLLASMLLLVGGLLLERVCRVQR